MRKKFYLVFQNYWEHIHGLSKETGFTEDKLEITGVGTMEEAIKKGKKMFKQNHASALRRIKMWAPELESKLLSDALIVEETRSSVSLG